MFYRIAFRAREESNSSNKYKTGFMTSTFDFKVIYIKVCKIMLICVQRCKTIQKEKQQTIIRKYNVAELKA